ncbi:Asx homology domain-containing protein [Chaetomidium leptoderma]|uniref:Asx homology domain-containing protein n=1 Tax=Chaetomidium leptoderma TaxID=669021 RepID=A0AAN6VRV9_9PEZI|nr:Asx homology domain-containing protein [Chaetomidium leptoderma]
MADDLPSSPLSSPPESVVNVAIDSPVKNGDKMTSSSDHQEVTAETVEVAAERPTAGPTAGATGDDEVEDLSITTVGSDDGGQSSAQKRKASISRKPLPVKKPRRVASATKKSAQDKKWEAPFVYTDSKSPLANADLRALLLHPQAWDVLTQEEKQDVLSFFPDDTHILDAGTPDARPNLVSLRNDDNFRNDCARYSENIELGRHDDEWLSQAWTAHEKHKRGDFNEFLRDTFEEDWETELPGASKAEDAEDAESDDGSALGAPESAESSRLVTQETPAPTRISGRASVSPQYTAGVGSPQDLSSAVGAKRECQNGVAKPAHSTTEAAQPIDSSNIDPISPSGASQEQDDATSIVAAPSSD